MFHTSYFFMLVLLITVFGNLHSEIITGGSKTLMSMPRRPCEVPSSKDYDYISSEGKRYDPKESIEGSGQSVVKVKCFDPNKLLKNDFAVCFDGKWYPDVHYCEQQKCSPRYDIFTEYYSCTAPSGATVTCTKPAIPGTRITIQCASRFSTSDGEMKQEKICLGNSEYEKWNQCKMQCGQVFKNKSLFRIDNNSTLEALYEHPWHVVIYLYEDEKWNQLCVGTLITSFAVVTAYDCYKGNWNNVGPLRIAVGKYYKEYYTNKEPSVTQFYSVNTVYRAKPHTIVILAVVTYIEFSDTVGSVCLDYEEADYQEGVGKVPEKTGNIVAWGKDETGSTRRVKISMDVDLIENCQTSKVIDDIKLLQDSQFCYTSQQHEYAADDIGSGLVFRKSDGKFYLRGILGALSQDRKTPIFFSTKDWDNRNFITTRINKNVNELVKKNSKYWYFKRTD